MNIISVCISTIVPILPSQQMLKSSLSLIGFHFGCETIQQQTPIKPPSHQQHPKSPRHFLLVEGETRVKIRGSLPGKEERKEGRDGGSPGLAQSGCSQYIQQPGPTAPQPPTIWHPPCLLTVTNTRQVSLNCYIYLGFSCNACRDNVDAKGCL